VQSVALFLEDPMSVPRLLRNERDGKGKYSVFDNRKNKPVLQDGPGESNEHFVIMLKDKYARAALMAYADAAAADGEIEYAQDVTVLANRAGPLHPNCKKPD
jgi:hypothetical protein